MKILYYLIFVFVLIHSTPSAAVAATLHRAGGTITLQPPPIPVDPSRYIHQQHLDFLRAPTPNPDNGDYSSSYFEKDLTEIASSHQTAHLFRESVSATCRSWLYTTLNITNQTNVINATILLDMLMTLPSEGLNTFVDACSLPVSSDGWRKVAHRWQR